MTLPNRMLFKIHSPEYSEKLQQKLFSLGYAWKDVMYAKTPRYLEASDLLAQTVENVGDGDVPIKPTLFLLWHAADSKGNYTEMIMNEKGEIVEKEKEEYKEFKIRVDNSEDVELVCKLVRQKPEWVYHYKNDIRFLMCSNNVVTWGSESSLSENYFNEFTATEYVISPCRTKLIPKEDIFMVDDSNTKPVELVFESPPKDKDSVNPKEKKGMASLPLHLFSPIATAYGCIGKLNGAGAYGLSNFVGTQVIMSIYVAAIRRHLDKIMAGEEYDQKDGVPHWSAILANVDIILCARAAGTLIDDRPLIKGYQEEVDKLTPLVSHLQELHKDKTPYHWYLKDHTEVEK